MHKSTGGVAPRMCTSTSSDVTNAENTNRNALNISENVPIAEPLLQPLRLASEEQETLQLDTTESSSSDSLELEPLVVHVNARKSTGGRAPVCRRRYDRTSHWPRFNQQKDQCRLCGFGVTHTECGKCKVHLCFNKWKNCFVSYHT